MTEAFWKEKLEALAVGSGYKDVAEMICREKKATTDIVAICTNAGCNFTVGMRPSDNRTYCESCNCYSVESCLSLAARIGHHHEPG